MTSNSSRSCLSLLCGLAALLILVPTTSAQGQKDNQEPPAEFVLEVNGKPVTVPLGKEIEVPTDTPTSRVKLTVRPERTFDRSGIRFRYPSRYVFKAESSGAGIFTWDISGTDCSLVLQRSPRIGAHALLKPVIDEIKQQFGAKNVQSAAITFRGADGDYKGTRLRITIASQVIIQDLYAFDTEQYTFMLMLQDISPSKTASSEEMKRLQQLLGGSWRVTGRVK